MGTLVGSCEFSACSACRSLTTSDKGEPHGTITVVQTLGTALQLSGSVITLGGLLWAWHVLSGVLTRWRDAVRGWPTRLRDSLAKSLGRQTSTGGTAQGSYGWTARAAGVTPTTGTPEERISQLEARLVEQRVKFTETLRTAIGDAIAAELEESKALRLRDIAWAAGGIAVSIIGYACQLIA